MCMVVIVMIKNSEENFTDQELFMAKQPINILFFNSLSEKLYPNSTRKERSKLLPDLFCKLHDSKIHNVIARLARLKLNNELNDDQIKEAVDIMVDVISDDLI